MPRPISLTQSQGQHLSQKQVQRLMLSTQMQQAIHLLQVPVMELSSVIEEELEQNPVLEYEEERQEEKAEEEIAEREVEFDDHDFEIFKHLDDELSAHFKESGNPYNQRTREQESRQSYLESSIKSESSLFEHLMLQAEQTFHHPHELEIAENIIGSLDENGYLQTSLEEIAFLNDYDSHDLEHVLEEVQQFDPIGIGATNLRESLLIQLKMTGKRHTLAYRIIEDCYDELIHNRLPVIVKTLRCSLEEIQDAIDQHISHLDLHPGTTHSRHVVQQITPDVHLIEEGEELIVKVNTEVIPELRYNRQYLRMMEDPSLSAENREYIKNKLLSAKWLFKTLDQRNQTIYRITEQLAIRQREFFVNPKGDLLPLTMKEIAEELELHESTIARTVSNKYLYCPRGLLPLRFFFTTAYETASGDEISTVTVQKLLKEIIGTEDKKKPLSDESIAKLVQKRGIKCARRTVAKLRAMLKIGNTRQRRQY